MIRGVRRVAGADPSPTLRAEAQRILLEAATAIANDEIGRYLTTTKGTGRVPSLLADKEPLIRAKVARCLALNLSEVIPQLLAIRLKEEPDPFVQVYLIQALAVSGGPAAIPSIEPHLKAVDARVRYSAVKILEV